MDKKAPQGPAPQSQPGILKGQIECLVIRIQAKVHWRVVLQTNPVVPTLPGVPSCQLVQCGSQRVEFLSVFGELRLLYLQIH